MLTIEEFIEDIRRGARIDCSNAEERTQSLILLHELGFKICDTTDVFDDSPIFLYPGIWGRGDTPEEITCWYDIEGRYIPYQSIPFDEHYSFQECTKEEFDKYFKMLMGEV